MVENVKTESDRQRKKLAVVEGPEARISSLALIKVNLQKFQSGL